jgi:DNA-binding NarL/FixJ family response regulator
LPLEIRVRETGPNQKLALQNCRFHIRHCLEQGRSVDSRKRCNVRTHLSIDEIQLEFPWILSRHLRLCPMQSASKTCLRMSRGLSRREQIVLDGLVQGFPLREVAAKFNFSYPSALKYRRRIATLALRLGVQRTGPPESARRSAKGPR